MVIWSEKFVASAYAALFLGTMPIWAMLTESILEKKVPKRIHILSVITCLSGLVLLTAPNLKGAGFSDNYWSIVTLLIAAASWGVGSVLQKKFSIKIPSITSSAYQQFFASLGLLAISLLLGEKRPAPSPNAWAAWIFLMLFGSVVSYTSFVKAVSLLPNRIVMTIAYVNPLIAIILGYFLLNERISLWTLAGTGMIILGVIGIFSKRNTKEEVPCSAL